MNIEKTIKLSTYGQKNEELKFEVSKTWLEIVIAEYGFEDLEEFLSEYTWDLSHEIFEYALEDNEVSVSLKI
ncbi:hypothetical protein P4T04_04660 [Bacillus badius]|uniref:hypothetical protein n=1 Tax=Bacillus badius TaxID=1455 RepID=UPI002E1E8267|nr:hypothetical protein [Bacillus badius]